MVVGEVAVETQVAVIGGGPGGYVCAIRLAQLGKQVMVIEKDPKGMGGICLNHGCIPSKALIHISNLADLTKNMGDIGITAKEVSIDVNKIQEWKEGLVGNLRKGVEDLCKKNGVEIIYGEATFEDSKRLKVSNNPEVVAVEYQQAVIATGSAPIELKGFQFDGKRIIDSTDALQLREAPKEFLVIGSGTIGIEMGTMYAKLGSKVKLVEKNGQILPGFEKEIVSVIEKRLKELGVEVYLNTEVEMYAEKDAQIVINAKQNGKPLQITADKVLVAVGRKPNIGGLQLGNTKVQQDEKGFIKVNDKLQTTDSRIYAIGDVVGGWLLAHKAFMEGKVAAEVIAGQDVVYQNKALPYVIFCDPEIARVGMSEKETLEKNIKVKIGKFPFRALGRAHTMENIAGFVKVIAEFDSNMLLGVDIVGPNASDLISEASLAIEMGARLEDLALTIHPHPTLPEGLVEAAEEAMGISIHFFSNKKK